ncbi:MAG: hypothetical protein V3U03_10355 [Myxococcota bacterium]
MLAAAGSRVQHRLQIGCTSPERGIEHALGQWAPDLLVMDRSRAAGSPVF